MDTLGKTTHQIEAQRWETPKSQGGMKPDRFEMFPMMLYRAIKSAQGQVTIQDADECQRIVGSEREMKGALQAGWFAGPQEALDAFEQAEQTLGQAAAERAASDRTLSKKAQAEAAAVDEGSAEHLGEIPDGRKPRR